MDDCKNFDEILNEVLEAHKEEWEAISFKGDGTLRILSRKDAIYSKDTESG
jgi:hypothetical protein